MKISTKIGGITETEGMGVLNFCLLNVPLNLSNYHYGVLKNQII